MVDPVRHRQLEELDMVRLCARILGNARNELYLNMHFLDLSLSSLGFEADPSRRGVGTDGAVIWYNPDDLCSLYRRGRIYANRAFLHMVFHCLFCHLDNRKGRAEGYWNLACDMAMESVIDGIYKQCVHLSPSPFRREIYLKLRKELKVLTAEGIYQALRDMNLSERQYDRLAREFYVDSHERWETEDPRRSLMSRQTRWNDNREKLQTEMESMGQDEAGRDGDQSLLDHVRAENRERYDYKRFLRKFSVLREENQVDEDSFDYVYYTYGLKMYGNMPLIEPLESKEVYRIEDFVLVIDTSMSCSGELVRRFLEETYGILSEGESYFKKINIHIIQCDDQVRSDAVITNREQMREYMENFTIQGNGGTDFRPAFEYVNGLRNQGEFTKLRGLLYFTDGKGIYPVKMPPYDTAFVFIQDQYEDMSVPVWAMKVILEEDEIREMI